MTGCLLKRIFWASFSLSCGTGSICPEIDTFAHVGSCSQGDTMLYRRTHRDKTWHTVTAAAERGDQLNPNEKPQGKRHVVYVLCTYAQQLPLGLCLGMTLEFALLPS